MSNSLFPSFCPTPVVRSQTPSAEEVQFHGGIAGASSERSASLTAANGFKEEGHARWTSGHNPFPAFIWYDFQNRQIRPLNVSFENGRYPDQMPTNFEFIGTNDDCGARSQWRVLCAVDDPQELSSLKFGACQVGDSSQEYRCLGLKILASKSNIRTSVRRIRMWHLMLWRPVALKNFYLILDSCLWFGYVYEHVMEDHMIISSAGQWKLYKKHIQR